MTTAAPVRPSTHPLLRSLALGALLITQSGGAAQPDDYLFGTWELVPSLSVYLNSPLPRSQTRIYRKHDDGVDATIITVDARGMEQRSSYVAPYDGVPHPVTGLSNADSVSFMRINPLTSVAEFTHAGLVSSTSERTLSASGQEMTITVRVDGEVTIKAVYEKKAE